ncbi:MAG TPA: divergent polysaccharide deacetylase family protein [Thermoanaerobaculia bacterium]|nr:divergent polysaccharide deacetylase family protein [Thermoanaerobaculia bacterium]
MARRRSPSRSRSRGGSRAGGALLFLFGLLAGAGILYLFLREPSSPAPPEETREEGPAPAVNEKPRAAERARPAAVVPPSDHVEPEDPTATPVRSVEAAGPDTPVRGVRVALVIDDLGRSLDDVQGLEALGVPLTYAVLPFEEHTVPVVAELRRARKEMLLHLPMEPKNGMDPGPGALLLGMSDDELEEKTRAALAAVPGAVGVNNHMGSSLSEDERSMDAVLGVIAGRHLFFLDSRTSAQSVGYKTAIRHGIPAAERQVFLDGDESPEAIRTQFQRLLDLARTRGVAIAIGHPHPETLQVLAEEVPRARALGYEFVPVSYLLDRPGDAE